MATVGGAHNIYLALIEIVYELRFMLYPRMFEFPYDRIKKLDGKILVSNEKWRSLTTLTESTISWSNLKRQVMQFTFNFRDINSFRRLHCVSLSLFAPMHCHVDLLLHFKLTLMLMHAVMCRNKITWRYTFINLVSIKFHPRLTFFFILFLLCFLSVRRITSIHSWKTNCVLKLEGNKNKERQVISSERQRLNR